MKLVFCFLFSIFSLQLVVANPVVSLLERIDKGASQKFVLEKVSSDTDFFELSQRGSKVVVKGNSYVNIATGVNWYLRHYAHIHLSWNGMTAKLPEVLPQVKKTERRTTDLKLRYDFNYCTYSYSMAFWDWERWEQELDWMALHGINLPLAIVGTETVWYNVLKKLGYEKDEINNFIAGPAFQAWWLMNNLEGWGGPNPDSWYTQRAELQKKIVKRMREYGIEPVFAGYSGMVPNNAKKRLGLNVQNPGLWCGYNRPAFLQPSDPKFKEIAALYYKEMTRLYGKANYYSMDPFHEGGSVAGVDLKQAGQAMLKAMKHCNPKAVWVIQAWGANPHAGMIRDIPKGDLLVLDLFSESRPQWGDEKSSWARKDGFMQHDWLYCMLLNFGGNVGLHGKMQHVIDEYFKARESAFGKSLAGVGMTMEGIENNPVMYDLLCDLPWYPNHFSKDEWLKEYVTSRYGKYNESIYQAWLLLGNSIYNCPPASTQQGAHESVFCARPGMSIYQVSSWSEMQDYYKPQDVIQAAGLFLSAANEFKGVNNYEYDLVDIVRQAVAEKGRMLYGITMDAYKAREKMLFAASSDRFMQLLSLQNELVGTRSEFRLGTWINRADKLGKTSSEKKQYVWNAKVQVTTWGNRHAANNGGLRDYAHREWHGLLSDFYAMRWRCFFTEMKKKLSGEQVADIDFYSLEEEWVNSERVYSGCAEGDAIETARRVYNAL